MIITESYKEYISERSKGKPIVHWASLIGKAIADEYEEKSFLVINIHASTMDFFFIKKEQQSSTIRVSRYLNSIPFLEDVVSFNDMIDDSRVQSWWRSVFFENDGSIQYDTYYDSLKVANCSDLTFGFLLEKISSSLNRVAKYNPGAVYIPVEYYHVLPFRYILQSSICKTIRVIPELKDVADEFQYVKQDCDAKDVPILPFYGGMPVTRLLGGSSIFVHVPLDEESLSCFFMGSKTWKDVITTTVFSYQISNIKYLMVKLDAQVDVFSNLFLSLSSEKWKTSILVDA